jgi:uncharacterized protein (TIGR03083 family)
LSKEAEYVTQASTPQELSTDPHSKAELLDRMRTARAELEQTLAGLDQAALTAPGPEGWSVKDHLAHLAAWGRQVLGSMDGRPSHEVLGVEAEVYARGDYNEMNALVRAQNESRSTPDVLAEFRRVHQTLVERVAALPEAELFGDDRGRLSNIESDSYEHDDEHREWIEAVLKHNGVA